MEYLDNIYRRYLSYNRDEETLKACSELLFCEPDRNTLITDSFYMLGNSLNDDEKEFIIEIVKTKIKEFKNKNTKDYSYEIDEYIEGVLILYVLSNKYEEGIKYFLNETYERYMETKMYIILNVLYHNDLFEEYIITYEKYKSKVKYRDELNSLYRECKEKIK